MTKVTPNCILLFSMYAEAYTKQYSALYYNSSNVTVKENKKATS